MSNPGGGLGDLSVDSPTGDAAAASVASPEVWATVPDPLDADPDNRIASKAHVVELCRGLTVPEGISHNPYNMATHTRQYIEYFEANPAIMGVAGDLELWKNLLSTTEAALIGIGYTTSSSSSKVRSDPFHDKVEELGEYEKKIHNKRCCIMNVVQQLEAAKGILNLQVLREQEAAQRLKAETERSNLQDQLDMAQDELSRPASRQCMVCARRLKDTLNDKEEVRCVSCGERGVCMDCWTGDRAQVNRFFTDPDKMHTCFRCVQRQNEQNMDVFCERVQTACGTLSDEDAQSIVEQMEWFHKLEDARAKKPEQVLAAYDLLRYPRLPRYSKKPDESNFKSLATAATTIDKAAKGSAIEETMQKKVIATTFQHFGLKTIFGTTKKASVDVSGNEPTVEGIESYFRELKEYYESVAGKSTKAEPFNIAVWLCAEIMFLIKAAKNDHLTRSRASLNAMTASERSSLEQLIRCTVYDTVRNMRRALKKGSLLTPVEDLLFKARYASQVRQLELRAVQGIVVTGRIGGDQQEIKVLQGQVRAQQAKMDRMSNAMGDGGAGGLRNSIPGDQGNGPLAGSLNQWVYKDVVEASEYKDMKATVVKLSADTATVEQRKNWANSAIRSHSKLVMFLFDAWYGQFRGGCRNCWVIAGGDPPEHSYQSCRSMKNKYNLICSNCNQYHDDWPECCPAISVGGAGGGDDDNSGKKGGGKKRNNKKMGNRQGGASGAGSWGNRNSNGNRAGPFT